MPTVLLVGKFHCLLQHMFFEQAWKLKHLKNDKHECVQCQDLQSSFPPDDAPFWHFIAKKLDMCKFFTHVFVVCVQFLNICKKNVLIYFTQELMFIYHHYIFSVICARYGIFTVEKLDNSNCVLKVHIFSTKVFELMKLYYAWQAYGFTLETSLFLILVLCAFSNFVHTVWYVQGIGV